MMPPEQTSKPRSEQYDERVHRKGNPPHRMRTAIIAIVVLVIGTYFAWTKELPLGNPYELKAVFANAVKIRKDSPVRVAGVNVGKVLSAERESGKSVVTFTVDPEGQPVRSDAYAQIRPRIFLEGNFFIDLKPGSPGEPELASGDTIPITQTATAVQLDEVLTALQQDDRDNLVAALYGFGTALNATPTPAEDAGQDPDVQGQSGGQALNAALDYGAQAGRDSAIVNEAFLGTEPGDLSRLLRSQSVVLGTLADREAELKSLITNYSKFTGAFARESESLERAVGLLGPTTRVAIPALTNLNRALPPLRAWSKAITPALYELPDTIAAGNPWLDQSYQLLAYPELGNVAEQLQLAGQPLGKTGAYGPGLFRQTENFARCGTEVLIPTGNQPINDLGTDTFSTGNPSYMDFFQAAVSLAGSAQNFDGNGPYLRTQGLGGSQPIATTNPGFSNTSQLWGSGVSTNLGSYGTRPNMGNFAGGTTKPAFDLSQDCYTQSPPDLNGGAAAGIGLASPRPRSAYPCVGKPSGAVCSP